MRDSDEENEETIKIKVENVVRRIKRERENKSWSQIDLSLRAGLSQNHVFAIESGARVPTLYTLLKLCDALNISPSVLFSPDNEEREKDRHILQKILFKYI